MMQERILRGMQAQRPAVSSHVIRALLQALLGCAPGACRAGAGAFISNCGG
jgi:hypothetical protein